MKIEIIMATMNKTNKDLIKDARLTTDAVIINQNKSIPETTEKITFQNYDIIWSDNHGKGLSRSRNMGLSLSQGDICLLADDDLVYVENYKDIIQSAFHKSDSDIICFQVHGIEKEFKKYSSQKYKVNFLNSMKISSVEIAVRKEALIRNKIAFDELFGSGSIFKMGEENIFLYDCLKKGMKIEYTPQKIADLHIGNSSWFKGFNEEYLIDRGAVFYRMSRCFFLILIIQFAIRKRSLFSKLSFYKIIKLMITGKKSYLENIKAVENEGEK